MINKFLNQEGLSTLISLIKQQISKISFGLLVTNKTESQETSSGESLNGVVNLHKISKTGNYNDLLNKPVIPTKTSQLQNDNGFIAIEFDPTVPQHVKEITRQNIVNWNNKLDSETDPTVPSHVKNITQEDINNWNNKLDSYTEVDPSVPNYVRNITQENINSWNNKVGTTDLATVATSGSYNDLTNKPTIPAAQIQSDWSQSDNTKKDYIKNKPTIPAAQVNADWNAASGVAAILNKPAIPVVPTNVSAFTNDASYATTSEVATKADKRTYVDNSADAIVELSTATYNDLGTLTTWKPVTLPAAYNRGDEFVFRFECGDASLSPALPAGVVLADGFDFSEMTVGVTYQVSIMDGVAAYLCITPNS